IRSRSTFMPSRISIGDWRLPVLHLFQSTLILLQLAGPLSPSYDQWVPRATGGAGGVTGAAAFATAARLARAAARAAWVARISARRAAMRSDRSTSDASSLSRAVGATVTGGLTGGLPFTDSVRVFMAAARAAADTGALAGVDADAAASDEADAGASLALAIATITARLQANRALKCRMEIQKVEYLLVYGCKATKLESGTQQNESSGRENRSRAGCRRCCGA